MSQNIKRIVNLSRRVRGREALNSDVFVREGKSPADEDELWGKHEEKEEAEKAAEAQDDATFSLGRTMAILDTQAKELEILNNLEARIDELERIDHYRHRCEHCNGPAHKGGSDVS